MDSLSPAQMRSRTRPHASCLIAIAYRIDQPRGIFSLQPRREALEAENAKIAAERAVFEAGVAELDIAKDRFRTVYACLEFRRWQLLQQLLSIFPIGPVNPATNCLTILNLPLPDSLYPSETEDLVSTAFGYCCIAMLLISKYVRRSFWSKADQRSLHA